jgi:hypothetical protein
MAVLGVALTVLMWSTLATSVNLLHGAPTLFVNGVALTLGGLLGLPWAKNWKLPISLVLLGSGLLFANHVIYFFALQLGDPIGVSLVHYLWPVISCACPVAYQPGDANAELCCLASLSVSEELPRRAGRYSNRHQQLAATVLSDGIYLMKSPPTFSRCSPLSHGPRTRSSESAIATSRVYRLERSHFLLDWHALRCISHQAKRPH